MDDDGFQLVQGKKSARRKNIKVKSLRPKSDNEEALDNGRQQKITDTITDSFMPELEGYNIIRNIKACMTCNDVAVEDLICYGIGSIVSSVVSQYQLALLTLLKKDLELSCKHCYIYDPLFCEADVNILSLLGYTVLMENEEGKRIVNKPTLFFMPHCGKALYNNLLWSNWHRDRLKHIMVLGNSFTQMETSTPSKLLHKEGYYIVKILPFIIEYSLKNNFHHDDIFNNLSLHVIDTSKLDSADHKFWDDCPEPQYDDDVADIILNKI